MKPLDLDHIKNEILSAEESRIFIALAQARVLGFDADKFLENLLKICKFLETNRKKLYSFSTLRTEIMNFGLKLNDLKLSSIPGYFEPLSEFTKQIDLSSNEFFVFPALLTEFKQLKKLNLSNNKLSDLPDSFINFTQLEELNLSRNLFVKFPALLAKFDSLKSLNLDCTNKLFFKTGLPKKLEKLHINFTKTISYPEEIFTCKLLKNFVLEGIAELPIDIAKLEKLESLHIERSGLETLPDTISDLSCLKRLSLRNLRLMNKIPEVIFKLQNLEELDFSGTPLMEFPAKIRHIKNLKSINLICCNDEITLKQWKKRAECWGIETCIE